MSTPIDLWQRALALMDVAQNLRPEQRPSWLDELATSDPPLGALLRKLLNAHERVETRDILATLPPQQRSHVIHTTGHVGQRVGAFELIELIGHGGMGSVWRARHADGLLARDVAVKLPSTTDNVANIAALRERFDRERDFLARVEHPHIARLYDAGVSAEGQPYLAMEYVAGNAIDVCADNQRLTIKARIELYLQVLSAVDYAHRQLILHRDLKPANVLVDVNGQARLLDFGVAKLLPTLTHEADAGSPAGGVELTEQVGAAVTLAYAAPEQINKTGLSTATDVYALGVMLFRILTGTTPYQPQRDTRGALEEAVLNVVPATASTRHFDAETLANRQTTAAALRRALAGDVDTILAKALKKNPEARYATAAAFADDLRRHLAREPIAARADSLWYQVNRFAARHRIATTLSAIGIALLLSTTGLAVWQARVATRGDARAAQESARLVTAQKFLAGVFAAADPEHSKGVNVTARDILDRGRDTAEKELADDPEGLAVVFAQIGDIYFRLGLPDQNLAVQQRRVAVLEAYPRADVNALVDAQLALAQARGESGDNAGAMTLLNSARLTGQTRGATADRIVWARALMTDELRSARRLPEAAISARELVALAEKTLPDPHPKLAAAHMANALVARDEGRIADARKSFAKIIAIDNSAAGRSKVDQALTRSSFAQLEFDAGDYLAASREALATLAMAEQNLGGATFNFAPARRIAVFATERAGDLALAQRYADALLPPEVASGQPLRVALAHMARARVAMSSAKWVVTDAELKLAEAVPLTNLAAVARLSALRAELLLRLDMATAAETLLLPLLASQLAEYGNANLEQAPTLEWLGVANARLGKLDIARRHFDESCRLRVASRAPAHPLRARCAAYQVLVDTELSYTKKISALREIEALVAGNRDDHIALLPSLHAAGSWFVRNRRDQMSPTLFPILD